MEDVEEREERSSESSQDQTDDEEERQETERKKESGRLCDSDDPAGEEPASNMVMIQEAQCLHHGDDGTA